MQPVSPTKTRIGWVGVGVMGGSMAGRLLDAGYHVTLYNRSRAKAEPLLRRGAHWAEGPRAVAEQSDALFTMVGYPADVRETVLGEQGALGGLRTGALLVDMTTSEPALAAEIGALAAERGVAALDAPVSGGDIGARDGRLSIMVGGDRGAFDALAPVWRVLGSAWVYQGEHGAGQHTKMVNQTLIAGQMVGVCEAMLYAVRAGLDPTKVLESVGGGAAGGWTLTNLAPRMLRGDLTPGFYVEHFLKDLRIVLAESQRMGLAMPGLALAEQMYRAVAAQGGARLGTQALVATLARLSNCDWPPVGGAVEPT